MNHGRLGSFIMSAVLGLALPAAFAQTTDSGAKQDVKDAGSDTKHAVTSVGHGIGKGTKTLAHKTETGTEKAYDKTKTGTKTAAHKTASTTEKGYDKTKSGTETAAHKTVQGTKTAADKVGDTVTNKHQPPADGPQQ